MNRDPHFDELVGAEPTGAERERLRQAHELLVAAGPPPELSPRLEQVPAADELHARRRRRFTGRPVLLLAAALVLAGIFAAAFGLHGNGKGTGLAATFTLRGTHAVPNAVATLLVDRESNGTWPMTLTESGLPLHGLYDVYLVRAGRPWLSCGTFVTTSATRTVSLDAPYGYRRGDSWVVTRRTAAAKGPGPVVLRPASA